MAGNLETMVRRFIRAVRDGEDVRKLQIMVAAIPKADLVGWKDNDQLDVLHYAILHGNAEAVDLLLKMGFFTAPHEPQVSMYPHLAARLGRPAVLCTILKHRPEDFVGAQLPLVIPPEFGGAGTDISSPRRFSPELAIPPGLGSKPASNVVKSTKDTRSSLANSFYQLTAKRSSSTQRRHSGAAGSISIGENVHCIAQTRGADRKSNRFEDSDFAGLLGKKASSTPKHETVIGHLARKLHLEKRRFSSPEDVVVVSVDTLLASKAKNFTPLDVAARFKHVDCVKALLDMYIHRAYPEVGSKGYLTLATLANNVPSLKLFLEPYASGVKDHNIREDYRMAVQVCLQNMFSDCLELLLNAELTDPKHIFKQINYFHVMYSQPFSSYHQAAALARLPVVTETLIDRGHAVMVKTPPRTYPLYTLIDNALSCVDYSTSEYIIICMKILMGKGADPNFDEVEHERQLTPSVSSRHYGGRYAYSSALHCVIQSLERNRDNYHSKSGAIRFVEDCVDCLIQYGADIEKMGSIDAEMPQLRGDILWQFARSSAVMGLERALLHCLTRFGAQPQRKIDGQFALNMYLDTVCCLMKKDGSKAQGVLTKRERDVGQMISLMCFFMAPWHIKAVTDIFNYKHKKCSGELHESYKRKVNEALQTQSNLIHTLRTIAAWQVWKLCKRKADNVKKLPVSKEIKTHVLPLVLFQTLW